MSLKVKMSPVITVSLCTLIKFVDDRLMSMLFELAIKCEAVKFVVAYAPTD